MLLCSCSARWLRLVGWGISHITVSRSNYMLITLPDSNSSLYMRTMVLPELSASKYYPGGGKEATPCITITSSELADDESWHKNNSHKQNCHWFDCSRWRYSLGIGLCCVPVDGTFYPREPDSCLVYPFTILQGHRYANVWCVWQKYCVSVLLSISLTKFNELT